MLDKRRIQVDNVNKGDVDRVMFRFGSGDSLVKGIVNLV